MFLSAVMAICVCAAAEGVPTEGSPAEVTFENGDRITGTIVSSGDGKVVIRHAVLGDVTVPASMLSGKGAEAATNGNAARPVAGDAEAAAEPPAPAGDAIAEAPTAADPWKASISMAATASKTSTSSYNKRLGAEAHRRSDAEQIDITASWYWNQSNGVTSDNDVLVRASQQWFIAESRWLYFAQGTWQYDQFESWTHRASPYGGFGYKWYDEDDLTLTLKAGGGVTWQYQGNEVDPQLLFEADTNWKITERQTLTGYASIAPDPVDFGNYLLTVSADWKMKLGDDTPWSFNLGLRNIYDSQPAAGANGNDFRAYAGLSMDF